MYSYMYSTEMHIPEIRVYVIAVCWDICIRICIPQKCIYQKLECMSLLCAGIDVFVYVFHRNAYTAQHMNTYIPAHSNDIHSNFAS